MRSLFRNDGRNRPASLFRQIAVRMAVLAALYIVLDIGVVLVIYALQPQSLAQEVLSLEAERIARAPHMAGAPLDGPLGADRWYVRTYSEVPPLPTGESSPARTNSIVDWTQRYRTQQGYRISGVRTIERDGRKLWLYMEFEGSSVRPYWRAIASELAQHVILPFIPLTLILLAFNVLAVRDVLGPVRRIEREVDELSADASGARLDADAAPREIRAMVLAINRAFGRQDAVMETLRDFTAHAAHELRTPLSIMRLTIEALPESDRRRTLLDDVDYMTRLVGQMLDLAQAEAVSLESAKPIDLIEPAKRVIDALEPKARQMGRALTLQSRGFAHAMAHEEAVFRILRNLVDNALAHGAGPVELVVGPGPTLSVADHGCGVSTAAKEHIFERFWRADRRASDGAGLGLAIVKRLMDALQGSISIEDNSGGGALFKLTFVEP